MSGKAQQRLLLISIPLLVNLLIIFGGLILMPTHAQADPRDGIINANDNGTPIPQGEIPLADNPPPPDELPAGELAGEAQSSNPVKSSFTITPTIYLKSRQFQPSNSDALDSQGLRQLASEDTDRIHVLVQLDFIPREKAKTAYAAQGLQLLAYVPDYAWIASLSTLNLDSASELTGVTWIGELTVEDKLDPAIQAGQWGAWNLTPNGTAVVNLVLHKDVSLDTGYQLAEAHGARVTGEVTGIHLLVLEIPKGNIRALAAEDSVQWIEPAAPPLSGSNDGIRDQIGVNTVNAAPYNLDGTGIDVLVYDSGQAGDHTDFGTRLIHGDADTVSDHSTHVAGTVGGSGANSAAQGGNSLQWRGMAPAVDLISYGTAYPGTGVIFYENVPDIQADWAAAQNTYGADLGTASLGSNIYSNYYPTYCYLMGNYGSSSVLIDQIVRGGNSAVGIGDKYIATWAAGNERGWGTSCAGVGGGYGIVAPPAGAKNPIHVGGSNTNNNTQYAHTSWGPTDDGRIKPIVTAGACQTTGDGGIKSTDDNPVDAYTVKCGTSMATPAVSGGIALMLQHYRDVYNTSGSFWPSTAKAILMQTADDFGNPGPDFQWGYGQVDIQAAVDLITRKAFRQDSVNDDEIDVFKLIVPPDADEVVVSLAWDDYEATLNANPTLINNLNLELVAPDGTIWRPWVLDPNNPANNATRGTDNRNNQEQVQVFAPDEVLVGTWLVRVKGTNIPQGPQAYSLVCEGCQPLNIGICQVEVSGTSITSETKNLLLEENPGLDQLTSLATVSEQPGTGEIWQRSLEAKDVQQDATEYAAGLNALEKAINHGPEAIVALLDTLRGPALDQAMSEITKAMEQLAALQPPAPETAPVSEADELAALEAQQANEADHRALALTNLDDPAEGQTSGAISPSQLADPNTPNADRTVGSGCTYASIAAAIAAANPNDRLLIEGGVTFTENLVINKNLTLSGGYNGCTSASTARTIIDGNASGSVIIVNPAIAVNLENLNITNGVSGFEGGGIRFAIGAGTGSLQLTNIQIYGNQGLWGGGLWVGSDAEVTGENVAIYDNTATSYGGGVRLYGGRATFSNSNIYNNNAQSGGGVYATLQNTFAPQLNLPSSADVYDNQALSGTGFGGGVYMRQGSVSIADCSDIYANDAIDGGGAYLITSTLTINGACSEIDFNTATGNGGGVYAQDSTVNLDDEAALYDNDAGTDGSGSGGGAYLDDSDLLGDQASIRYNSAGTYGGGIYATNGSMVDMDLGGYPCTDVRCSQLSNNTATSYGGGIYARLNSDVYLDNTFVENNTGILGGGMYLLDSGTVATLNNNLFARNDATSNTGDAIRLSTNSGMSGSGNTFAYNNAGGAATGQAIGYAGTSFALNCSIVWGHSSSILPAGLNVSHSDIQGGYAGSSNINVNPLFVSVASQDYHLQNTSPVIDRCPSFSGMTTDFENNPRPIVISQAASPYDMGADETTGAARVGVNGACTYGTVQQAIDAASNGDTIRVSAGVYFENVDINDRSLSIEGDYNSSCTATGGGTTRIEGSVRNESTLSFANSTVTLRNLEIAWGGGSFGGGIQALNSSQITLDNADVFNNHAAYGGGIYISSNSEVNVINGFTTADGSEIHHNTASTYGGGVRVWGQFNGNGNYSDIYDNCAPHGGGFDVPGGTLNLNAADVYLNQAAEATGQGGGIRLTSGGEVNLSNGAYVYYLNEAYDGAGIFADNSQVTLTGGATTLRDNVATHNGGSVYLTNGSLLQSTGARVGQSGSSLANEALNGAGIYASASTVNFDGGYIINNIAANSGGGIYADNSTITLTGVQVGDTAAYYANQLGSGGHNGAGLYLTGATQATLDNTFVAGNLFQTTGFTYGGGVYVDSSTMSLTNNSRIQEHTAPSVTDGRGAGIYINNGTVTIDNSQVISNTAGAVGGGIRLLGSSVLNILNGSVIANNEALNGEGGGIAASGSPNINIANAALQDNAASTNGGAIYSNSSAVYITQSYFNDNIAARGGAVFQTGTGAQAEIENSLIHHNTSTAGLGAGIRSEEGVFTTTHVTLAENQGGAGYSQSNTVGSATNSIAWGNTNGGFWVTSGTLTGVCSLDQSGNAGPSQDPRFVNAAGENYHLLGTSPAINACASGLPTDLDGISRPFGSSFDMGAYEYTAGVTLTPNHSGSGQPATTVSYVHTLTNQGSSSDSFTLSASSSRGWTVTLDPIGPVVLASGQSRSVTVRIAIPAGTPLATMDTTTVTAASSVDPTLTTSATDSTLTEPYGIYLPIVVR